MVDSLCEEPVGLFRLGFVGTQMVLQSPMHAGDDDVGVHPTSLQDVLADFFFMDIVDDIGR